MTENTPTFADLGVAEPIVAALAETGICNPFPIQELAIPIALTGADMIGQARTERARRWPSAPRCYSGWCCQATKILTISPTTASRRRW